jgi:hypothetical protein
MNLKKIIITILVLGTIIAVLAYKMYNKPHLDVASAKADVTISANDLINAFSTNESDANAKYLEKIIEVKGTVSSFKIEKEKGIVSIETEDDFGSILCHLSEASTLKMKELKGGQAIAIKGICTGFLMDVILVKSEIIN